MTLIDLILAGQSQFRLTRKLGPMQAVGELVDRAGTRTEVVVTLRRLGNGDRATMTLYRSREQWGIAELEAEGLPLYWSRTWLVRQLTDYKSFTAIEAVSGYPARTLKAWKVRHKIHGSPREDAIRKAWASEAFSTRAALAAAYDISLPVLRKILRD